MLGALIAASVFAFRSGWQDIYIQASKRVDNGYIFLVPLVAAYLAWIRWARAKMVVPAPSLWGVVVGACGAAFALLGEEKDLRIALHFSAVLGLVACFVTLAGPNVLRQFAPAFLALLFLMPVPGEVRKWLASPLQDFATGFTYECLLLFGIGVVREGNVLVINGAQVFVGEACDGMRMVFALALTVFAFVFSVPLRLPARLVLLAASPLIAIVCNIVRLVPTAIAYAYTSPERALQIHDIAGWLMLPLAILLLLGIIRFMRWLDLPVLTWRFLQA
ncbi:MAG: exosortase/archaeosortase family protein [Planctomycetota bacterium]